ncbi:MAG: DUF1801 domain-containing protein [Bacteroidota bacterium]
MNPAEHYILDQPEPFRAILLHIQVIIEHTVPDATLQYKYHIPFYYVKGNPFCYLNVSHKKRYVGVPESQSTYGAYRTHGYREPKEDEIVALQATE